MASRDFKTVFNNILAIAPEELERALKEKEPYWDPENNWDRLAECVSLYIRPNSKDALAIAIYAELCGVSYSEIKDLFDGEEF